MTEKSECTPKCKPSQGGRFRAFGTQSIIEFECPFKSSTEHKKNDLKMMDDGKKGHCSISILLLPSLSGKNDGKTMTRESRCGQILIYQLLALYYQFIIHQEIFI